MGKGNGDLNGVKIANGRQLTPDSDEMHVYAMAYARGCYVQKNTVIARKLLEQWANAHHDEGKKAAASHCTLAEWYRFGIGGPKNEATAIRWEERFVLETGGGYSCSIYARKPLIDPADPWKTIQ